MKTRTLIRYYRNGWHHAVLQKTGRKWLKVKDLHLTRNSKTGKYYRRVRRVRVADTAPPLWE